MRFFSGIRDKAKGNKPSASALFKQKQNAKPGPELTADEKYKQMLEARIDKLKMDAMMGKKGGFRLPGTKESDKPKEMSKNAKQMMELLAMQKAQKAGKAQKKKEAEWQRTQKAVVKSALTAAEKAADELIEQAKKEAEAVVKQKEQQPPQSSYFFGYSDDKDS